MSIDWWVATNFGARQAGLAFNRNNSRLLAFCIARASIPWCCQLTCLYIHLPKGVFNILVRMPFTSRLPFSILECVLVTLFCCSKRLLKSSGNLWIPEEDDLLERNHRCSSKRSTNNWVTSRELILKLCSMNMAENLSISSLSPNCKGDFQVNKREGQLQI